MIVGEDHDWGEALADGLVDEDGDPLAAIAARYRPARRSAIRHETTARAEHVAREAEAAGADVVLAWIRTGDDALALGRPAAPARARACRSSCSTAERRGAGRRRPGSARMSDAFRGARGTRRLEASAAALAPPARVVRRAARAGRGRASRSSLVDADVPHELLRAMDIPYVVNQWWASICSAKQRAPHYLALLRERGYPD